MTPHCYLFNNWVRSVRTSFVHGLFVFWAHTWRKTAVIFPGCTGRLYPVPSPDRAARGWRKQIPRSHGKPSEPESLHIRSVHLYFSKLPRDSNMLAGQSTLESVHRPPTSEFQYFLHNCSVCSCCSSVREGKKMMWRTSFPKTWEVWCDNEAEESPPVLFFPE